MFSQRPGNTGFKITGTAGIRERERSSAVQPKNRRSTTSAHGQSLPGPLGTPWDTMQARERDAWLARAIGWTVTHHMGTSVGFWLAHSPKDLRRYMAESEEKAWEKVPYYTTDIAAAMGLLEEMREQGWIIELSLYPDVGLPFPSFRCALSSTLDAAIRVYGTGSTLPAAISACVYRALGGEDA